MVSVVFSGVIHHQASQRFRYVDVKRFTARRYYQMRLRLPISDLFILFLLSSCRGWDVCCRTSVVYCVNSASVDTAGQTANRRKKDRE